LTRLDGPAARPGLSSRTVLAAIFKDLWKIAAAFLLTVGAAGALAYLMTPKYAANASLYVKFGREYMYRADSYRADA
jgi:uncharacterized protein involved in exopolysaccharide biosynthesis